MLLKLLRSIQIDYEQDVLEDLHDMAIELLRRC